MGGLLWFARGFASHYRHFIKRDIVIMLLFQVVRMG